MPPAPQWRSEALQRWLSPRRTEIPNYRHLYLGENDQHRDEGLAALGDLVREAHSDARKRMERLTSRSLDPLDPAGRSGGPSFPDDLHPLTLHGYLGEVMAGLVAENYEPHAGQWFVPAFLFRGHAVAFQALERARQRNEPPGRIPGRTGDDALAFQVDEEGEISAWLFGEAKCTPDHDAGLIRSGHEQLSAPEWLPVDLAQLIEILEEKDTMDGDRWANALRVLNWATESTAPPRFDMFVYVCGRRPQAQSTWISPTDPHHGYTGGNALEAVEVHLDDFASVLSAAYPGHIPPDG